MPGQTNVLPPVNLVFQVGSTDLSEDIMTLRMSWPWGGKASLQGTLVEIANTSGSGPYASSPNPAVPNLIQPFPQTMFPDNFSTSTAILQHYKYPALASYYPITPGAYPGPTAPPAPLLAPTTPNPASNITANIKILSINSSWPTFLCKSPKTTGMVTSFSGEDFTGLLELKLQQMPNIFFNRNPMSAQNAITQTCAYFGINTVNYNWPDFPVHQLQRSAGKPLNWVDLLSRPYQAVRYFKGQTMYSQSLGSTVTGSALGPLKVTGQQSWTLTDYKVIRTLDVEFAEPPINQFTVARTNQNNFIGEANCTGGQCVGRTLNVTFSHPCTSVTPNINKVVNGSMIDFVYFDTSGNPINPTSPITGTALSTTPIASVQATYIPNFTEAGGGSIFGAPGGYLTPSFVPAYDVSFTGGTDSTGAGSSTTSGFMWTSRDTTAVGMYGLNPEWSVIDDPILPTIRVCEDAADCMVTNSVRKTFWCHVSTPVVNPMLCPGDLVTLVDFATRQAAGTETQPWFVEQVDFIMAERDAWSMELILTKGPSW